MVSEKFFIQKKLNAAEHKDCVFCVIIRDNNLDSLSLIKIYCKYYQKENNLIYGK